MRKNRMMRLASVILVLTLLSTCAISGTFAKYVTSDSASDEARVAKWGVTVTAAGTTAFNTQYTNTENAVTVKSDSTDELVAPGTKNETGITFEIKGTPEVATKIDIDMKVEKDVYLKAGTYTDYTTTGNAANNNSDQFTTSTDYYPVKFTLTQTSGWSVDASGNSTEVTTPTPVVTKQNLAAIETAVEQYATNAKYAPNTKLDAKFVLTWEWDFSDATTNNNPSINDKADTLLGNLAADANTYKGSLTEATWSGSTVSGNYSTALKYEITFTVTQVD